VEATTELSAYAGGRAIVLRYATVGLLSLGGATILIRELGAESWATYSVAYFVLVSIDQALGARLLGSLIRSPHEPSTADLQSSVFLMHVLGLVFVLLFALLAWTLHGETALPDLSLALLSVGIAAYLYAFRAPAVVLLERDLGYRSVALAEVGDQLTFYAFAISLVLADVGLPGVLIALAIRGLPATLFLRWRSAVPLVGKPDRSALRDLFAFSAPSLLVGAILLLEGLTPAFLLAGEHPDVLAYFMTASTVVGYASVVQYVTQRVGFPAFSRVANTTGQLARATTRSLEMTALCVVTMVAPLTAVSPIWLPALFGEGWERAAGITVAIGIAFSANACLFVLTGTLYAMGRPRIVSAIHGACLSLFVALALVGTANNVLIGAAVAYAISRYAGLLGGVAIVRRVLPDFAGMQGIALLVWGGAFSSATATAIDHGAWVAAVACGLIFLAVWLCVLWRHRAWLRRALLPRAPVGSGAGTQRGTSGYHRAP
jgi:O-antigen/teichoic acid export membrane protein